jgi:hypothetical protein
MLRCCLALLVAACLASCGGGSGGSGDTPAPAASVQGSVSLSIAGGAAPGYDHVWVTVSAVALHTEADRAWGQDDASWQVIRLASPHTLDLAALTNGAVSALFSGNVLPAGSYAQLRLFVLPHDATLADAARQLNLAYNAQVDYTDAAGVQHRLPLELADASLGLRVDGPIVVTADQDTDLALQWDVERSVARFAADDGVDRMTMRPDLRWYDLSATGAIVGLMDKSLFCAAGVKAANCLYDVVVSAEAPSTDGRFKRSVRSAPVVLGDTYAVFALYPLPASSAEGRFDVVIRGRNMQTMVVRAVPASAADLLAAAPTQLGANPADPTHPVPMQPVLLSQGEASVSLSQPLQPASAQIVFGRTLPGSGELPLELVAANTDPFTGRLTQPLPLAGGALRVATYSADTVLSFADVTPAEGDSGFSMMSLGTRYDDASATSLLSAPGGSSTAFVAPAPSAKSGLASATLTVALSGGTTASYDAAQLVIADVAGVVQTREVSSLIGSGGTLSLTLPAGAAAASLGGTAVYAVSVRAWKRSAPSSSLRWVRTSAPVDLRSASSAQVSLTLP